MRSGPNRGPRHFSQARSGGNSQLTRILTNFEFFENRKAMRPNKIANSWESMTVGGRFQTVLFLGLNQRESTLSSWSGTSMPSENSSWLRSAASSKIRWWALGACQRM